MKEDERDAEPREKSEVALQRFLFEHVTSYEELAVLLLLLRNADRVWSPDAVAEELGRTPSGYHAALESLAVQGLLTFRSEDSFAYAPMHEHLARAAETLDVAYQTDRTSVIRLMNTNAVARLRTGAVRAFSDILRLQRIK